MSGTHHLKTINPYFTKCWECSKNFEVRKNDRDFQSGDKVWLEEYDPETQTYSGRKIVVYITYVLSHYEAIKEGYVVFGFQLEKHYDKEK